MSIQSNIMDKQNKNTHIVIRINENLKKKYKNFCDENGYTLSKRIISLIIKELNGAK